MTDDELAQKIRDMGIDILVDVAGHTNSSRLTVFAQKPAPVSISRFDLHDRAVGSLNQLVVAISGLLRYG